MKQDIKHTVITFLSAQGTTAQVKKAGLDKSFDAFCAAHGETRKPAFKTYYQLFVEEKLTLNDLRPATSSKGERQNFKIAPSSIVIEIFKPGKEKLQKGIFEPYKTGKGIDILFSVEGGIMKGTTVVISGPAGSGKSTAAYDVLCQIKKNHPTAKVAVANSEMKKIDLEFELARNKKTWMADVEFIVLKSIQAKDAKGNVLLLPNGEKAEGYAILDSSLEAIFSAGYDFIVVDSVEDIVAKLKMYCDMTEGQAENFILGLFDNANDGVNNQGKFTAILAIQQVTKGDVQKGSNKLSHNTTGQVKLYIESTGKRYARFSKNRRSGSTVGKKMYYSVDKEGNVLWDLVEYEEMEANTKMLNEEKSKLQTDSANFNKVFGKVNEFEADRQPGAEDDDESVENDFNTMVGELEEED